MPFYLDIRNDTHPLETQIVESGFKKEGISIERLSPSRIRVLLPSQPVVDGWRQAIEFMTTCILSSYPLVEGEDQRDQT